MTKELHGLNIINAGGHELLLTETSGGTAVHLSRSCEAGGTARAAVHDFYVDDDHLRRVPTMRNYNRKALLDLRWSDVTLCGREWLAMAGGEGGPLSEYSESAFAPTCRRCLALMDKLFPEPVPDKRLPLVVKVITDLVLEHGYAEMHHVPGDQQAALRKQVRAQVRQLTGHGTRSYVHESAVFFVCEAIHDLHAEEKSRAAVEAIGAVLSGEPVAPLPTPWRISWNTWSIS